MINLIVINTVCTSPAIIDKYQTLIIILCTIILTLLKTTTTIAIGQNWFFYANNFSRENFNQHKQIYNIESEKN